MGKRNKVRYKSEVKDRKKVVLTGNVFLKYEDDDEDIAKAVKGDMLVYPIHELDGVLSQIGYETKGHAGYFKVDVFEGNVWCLVLIHNIFPHREHYFSKTEYPIDTFKLIGEMLVAMEGKTLSRTYREHYELLEEDNEEQEEESEE